MLHRITTTTTSKHVWRNLFRFCCEGGQCKSRNRIGVHFRNDRFRQINALQLLVCSVNNDSILRSCVRDRPRQRVSAGWLAERRDSKSSKVHSGRKRGCEYTGFRRYSSIRRNSSSSLEWYSPMEHDEPGLNVIGRVGDDTADITYDKERDLLHIPEWKKLRKYA